MLTGKTISPKQGERYYAQDNYYSRDEVQANSQWLGEGAEQLGLSGPVDRSSFENLLHGYLPDGEAFRAAPNHSERHQRGGLDCTYSAPKSVSVAALAQGEGDLAEAHQDAIAASLQVMEERYAQVQQRSPDGTRQTERTRNLTVAQFAHDASREKDPHLHTHCVVLNATQNQRGNWRALDNSAIYRHKKLLGTIYQNELARQAQRLGYSIERRPHGQFELRGPSNEQRMALSKRRQQILQQANSANWAERERAWTLTRRPKGGAQSRDTLAQHWQQELQRLQIAPPQPERSDGGASDRGRSLQ